MEKIISIDKSEVLRYLGYKGGELPAKMEALIDCCIVETEEVIVPRYYFQTFQPGEICLLGKDIAKHLEGCDKWVLLAATVGMELDALIRKAQVSDMSKAVIFDACGSSAIEVVCDQAEAEIRRYWQERQKAVTGRFSPGYGDMPISQQKQLCGILDAAKRIGLYVNDRDVMIPMKSVTAVLGIGETALHLPNVRGTALMGRNACETCTLSATCGFKKEGNHCGKQGN